MNYNIKSVKASQEYSYQRKGEPYKESNKLYLWVSGETLLENLANRHSRPHNYYKKEVLPSILREVATKYPELSISTDIKDWSWSQKCGCSMCPCSPGFVQKNIKAYRPINIQAEVVFVSEPVASLEEA